MKTTSQSLWVNHLCSAIALMVLIAFNTSSANGQSELAVDGMVGQVNGQAIYAQTVFREIEEQLRARGKTDSLIEFRRLAEERIHGQLVQIVTDKLVLSEAERDLSPEDERRVRFILQKEREELLRLLGQGSIIRANRESIRVYQKPLKGVLEDKRAELVVRRYMFQKFMPQIVIRQKDVINYFNSHREDFEKPAKRIVHLIRPVDDAAVSEINKRLADGRSFLEVAGDDSLNAYRADAKGMYGPDGTVIGNLEFGEDNAPFIAKLKAGEHTEQLDFGNKPAWFFAKSYEPGEKKTLRDVQLQIENTLRNNQFRQLTEQYRREAEANGNHTPIEQMRNALVEIAIVRYYVPQSES